ncbi:hypothetical protein ACJJIR_12385 [Microbulbifer sp. SSSA008]|uniref:hypothetical protein n=1 Tax=Microbulbifer sp. SSSA008 TaxID=3243380 RepID=UPI00403A7413
MNHKLRYILAFTLGSALAVILWFSIATSHPIFMQLKVSGLIPPVIASLVAGAVTSAILPSKKVSLTFLLGCLVALPMLLFLLWHGFSHLGRNPLLWYWPIYVPPAFLLGGLLTRGVWRAA